MVVEAERYIRSLYTVIGRPIIITDRDRIVAAAGYSIYMLTNKAITDEFIDIIKCGNLETGISVKVTKDMDYEAHFIYPIVSGEDVIGSIAILGSGASELDIKIIQVAVDYLAKFNLEC